MFEAIKETVKPNGGHGMSEALIFVILLILVVGAIVLNYMGKDIDPVIIASISSIIGWVVRGNKKEQWTGEERRSEDENG